MTRVRSLGCGTVLAGLAICGAGAGGQGTPVPGPRAPAAPLPACDGRIVSSIDVTAHPPFEPGGPPAVRRLARIATNLHATTNSRVILRYLALRVGEPCTEFRRQESERILRAQPFLADARVVVAPDAEGGAAVRVVTVDEVSLVLDGSISNRAPMLRALRLGDNNLAGEAVSVVGRWQQGIGFRDAYKVRAVDYQLLGRPYRLAVQGTRNMLGGSWDAEASHPFFTNLQRFSWRATAGSFTLYQGFVSPGEPRRALEVRRDYGDVGGVVAFGPVLRKLLVGGTVSRERELTDATPLIMIPGGGMLADTAATFGGRYGMRQATRANLLLGLRDLRFIRASGFDAIEGTQDLRTGVQFATVLGKGLRLSQADEPDYFVSGHLYTGAGNSRAFLGAEAFAERRYGQGERDWDGGLVSGRVAGYLKPTAPRQTLIASLEFSGGWRQRVPFQLTFADRLGGLRGYNASRLGGARRIVLRLEDRYPLGHVRQFAAVAGAAFVDAGKLWAGDAPLGVTTGVKLAAGVSLLAAVPPRSRRTLRVDLAVPVNDRGDARRVEVRFSSRDFTRWFWREPGDVQLGRERAVPNSVYNWP